MSNVPSASFNDSATPRSSPLTSFSFTPIAVTVVGDRWNKKNYYYFLMIIYFFRYQKWMKMGKKFKYKWDYPFWPRARDGTLIALRQPPNSRSGFFSYKRIPAFSYFPYLMLTIVLCMWILGRLGD